MRRTPKTVKTMRQVAEIIEAWPEDYNQATYGDVKYTEAEPHEIEIVLAKGLGTVKAVCGTAHCIAGWAAVTQKRPEVRSWYDSFTRRNRWELVDDTDTWHEVGRKALGLTNAEADMLFAGNWEPKGDLTPAEALRKIAKGASVWSVTARDEDDFLA